MTSSLVGSEMCIRDRNWTSGGKDGLSSLEQGKASRSKLLPVGTGVDGPVSYTHLTLPTICSV
eukprot:8753639-Prorocentrum_lima.AAC.1